MNIARENSAVPEGNGLFATFSESTQINSAGHVVFSDLRNTSGGIVDNEGLYFYNGTAVVKLAHNENVPEGDGQFAVL